jgi:DNA mismatch repair protein MutL
VFETTADNAHVVISGIPVKLQRVRFLVLEQLLSDLEDGIPENSFSQNDTIAKSMAKSLAVKQEQV